ncbi:MAG: 1-phosphofructokinase family hexose kinase [Candidatus Bipolaricaulia bacterium]
MIITVTLNPAVDKTYWVENLRICETTEEEFLTTAVDSATSAGGKGINMSVFLSKMGMENIAMGFVGGHTGHVVVRDLRDRGVTTNFVWTREETRTNVTVLERGHEYVPLFIGEPGRQIETSEVERFRRKFRTMLSRASWVVLAGSLPPGVDVDLYRDLATMAQDAGAKVVVSARGEALMRTFEACPYLVKPDTREHRELMGIELASKEKIIEAGRRIASCGAEMVVISHQVTGDIAVTRDAVWEIRTPVRTAEFRNIVGADDALLAGILYRIVQGDSVEEALRFGLGAGLASAESDEKVCGELDKIEAEMAKVTVERI